MKNWKTTVVGGLTGVVLLLTQVVALLDSNPDTIFSLEIFLSGLGAMGIGYFAKDAGVSGTEK